MESGEPSFLLARPKGTGWKVDGSGDAATAALRVARNQSLFRAVNEQIEATNEKFHVSLGDRIDLVCECAADDCMERITVTLEQYEQLRRVPTHFMVKPGHVYPEFERVVEKDRRVQCRREVRRGRQAGAQARSKARRWEPLVSETSVSGRAVRRGVGWTYAARLVAAPGSRTPAPHGAVRLLRR